MLTRMLLLQVCKCSSLFLSLPPHLYLPPSPFLCLLLYFCVELCPQLLCSLDLETYSLKVLLMAWYVQERDERELIFISSSFFFFSLYLSFFFHFSFPFLFFILFSFGFQGFIIFMDAEVVIGNNHTQTNLQSIDVEFSGVTTADLYSTIPFLSPCYPLLIPF